MVINKEIRSNNPQVDKYIEDLEDFVTGLKASNILKLAKACDDMAGTIADDIRKLGSDRYSDDEIDGELQILGSKRNKRYETFLATLKQIKDFASVSAVINDLKPKEAIKSIASQKQENKKIVPQQSPSMQDLVINKNANR